MLIKKVEL